MHLQPVQQQGRAIVRNEIIEFNSELIKSMNKFNSEMNKFNSEMIQTMIKSNSEMIQTMIKSNSEMIANVNKTMNCIKSEIIETQKDQIKLTSDIKQFLEFFRNGSRKRGHDDDDKDDFVNKKYKSMERESVSEDSLDVQKKTNEQKLDYDNVLIRPKGSTLKKESNSTKACTFSDEEICLQEALEQFFQEKGLDKNAAKILTKWRGKYDIMLTVLKAKYDQKKDNKTVNRLEKLILDILNKKN